MEKAHIFNGMYGGGLLQLFGGGKRDKKITSRIRWLQNDVRNTTINQKQAASILGRWVGTRERRGAQGERDSIVLEAIVVGSVVEFNRRKLIERGMGPLP